MRDYAIAATRHILALNEAISLRDAQMEGLRLWFDTMRKEEVADDGDD